MTTAEFIQQQMKSETEEQFLQRVIHLAHALGWKVAHFRPVRIQRANGSVYYETPVAADGKGFPDLVMVRDRVLFVELKRENGKLDPAQEEWRDAIAGGGGQHYTFKPRHWAQIEALLK